MCAFFFTRDDLVPGSELLFGLPVSQDHSSWAISLLAGKIHILVLRVERPSGLEVNPACVLTNTMRVNEIGKFTPN